MEMNRKVVELNIDDVLPNRFQPRIKFNEEAINELSTSIKEHGVIQPIVVRPIGDKYEIIAGERRYKASCMAGKETIPAIITDLNDKDSAEVALIENVQRENLTPIEEAISYKKILDMGYITQDALAAKLGKTQSTVANKLRLLNLDDEVQEALLKEKISERHARSLLKLTDKEQQRQMLNRIIAERLPVRRADEEIEKIINGGIINNEQEGEANKVQQEYNYSSPQETQTLEQQPFEDNSQQMEAEPKKFFNTLDELPKDTEAPSFKFINFQNNNLKEPKEQTSIDEPKSMPEPEQMPELRPGKFFNILNEDEEKKSEAEPKNEFNFDNLFINPISTAQSSNALLDEISEIEKSINNSNKTVEKENIEKQDYEKEEYEDFESDFEPINSDEEITATEDQSKNEKQVIEESSKEQVQPEQIFSNNEKITTAKINNFKDVLQSIRSCSDEIEKAGFVIDTEEYDLEGMYQVVFKISKD